MMTGSVLQGLVLIVLVARAGPPAGCLEQLGSYGSSAPPTSGPLELQSSSGGALLYLPVRHTEDPGDSQLQSLEREWRRFRPTVAFFEGHRDEIDADREGTVRRFGEAGWVRYFARSQGVLARHLEPSPAEEVRHVLSSFSEEEVQLTYLLLEALLSRERRGGTSASREATMEALLAGRANPALPRVITSRAQLDEAFARHFGSGYHWSSPPQRWFDPFRSGSETGGHFTNEVVRAASAFRDRHMVSVLVDAVQAGERVLAVVGETHVAMQSAALRCALQ